MSNRQAKPREMTPEFQKTYDAVVAFLTALVILVMVALGLTMSFNLATPITHLEPISPFAVFGILAFADLVTYEARALWKNLKR